MGSSNLYTQVTTSKTPEEIKEGMRTAFRSLGGAMEETPTGFAIKQGAQGVSFAFTADIKADVNLRHVSENRYEVECLVNWKMNALSWICFLIGFFIFGILWIVPILYLFVRPTEAYQQALNRVQTYVG